MNTQYRHVYEAQKHFGKDSCIPKLTPGSKAKVLASVVSCITRKGNASNESESVEFDLHIVKPPQVLLPCRLENLDHQHYINPLRTRQDHGIVYRDLLES